MNSKFSSRIQILPLLKGYKASTDGTQTSIYLDLEVPAFTELLPHAESMTLITLTEGAPSSGNFEWNIGFLSGFDRGHQGSFIKLGDAANITTNVSQRHSAYSTISNFLLNSRLQLLVKNKDGQTGVQTATLSAVLLVQLIGQ